MTRRLAIGLARMSALLLGVALPAVALAAPPSSLRVGGDDGGCPTPVQVAVVLRRLLRQTKVTVDTGPPGPDYASISDQGSRFRVTVAGQERSFDDASRACDERAQHAAVFVALVLDPPMIAEPPPEPATPAPAPPVEPTVERPTPPTASGANGPQWDLTLQAVVLTAPTVRDRRTAIAGGAAAWVRGKRGFHLGFGAGLLHGSLHFANADADAWWIPIDVAAGLTARAAAWEVGAEIGPSASLLSIVGENLRDARPQVRLEIGGRASAWSRFWLNRKFALSLSVDAIFRPAPYALQINPDGEVGQTPGVWLGVSAGLSAALD